jgi:prevent-host-death family protein
MKAASVRELKNRTSALLRQAAREDVLITSRGRPVACLMGLTERDLIVLPARTRRGLSVQDKKKMFLLASSLWRLKPEKGKKWVSQEHHDAVLYGKGAP